MAAARDQDAETQQLVELARAEALEQGRLELRAQVQAAEDKAVVAQKIMEDALADAKYHSEFTTVGGHGKPRAGTLATKVPTGSCFY